MTFDLGRQTSGEKPCRACTDFKDWLRVTPAAGPKKDQEVKAEESVATVAENPPSQSQPGQQPPLPVPPSAQAASPPTGEQSQQLVGSASKVAEVDQAVIDQRAGVCPPDRSGLGSATWSFLHSVAAYFPASPR
jgi:hypothetical protein